MLFRDCFPFATSGVYPSQGSSGLGFFLLVLNSFPRPCNWKLLVPLELSWALVAPSPLGMQINVGFICNFYNPLAVFSPFVPCQRLSFLREFRGIFPQLVWNRLVSWTFREPFLLCVRIPFRDWFLFALSLTFYKVLFPLWIFILGPPLAPWGDKVLEGSSRSLLIFL